MLELPRKADGKRQRVLRRARTEAEAKRLLRELRREFDTSGKVASVRRTVADAVEEYKSTRSASAHDDWLLALIVEGLGGARVGKLTVQDADEFLQDAANGLNDRRPIGKSQIGRVRQALVSVLTNEQRLGHVIRNVGELADTPEPGAKSREPTALTVDELDRLIDVATLWPLLIVELCGRNGLRPAEARALRWIDLDLDEGLLSVTGQNNRANQRSDVKRANNASRTIYPHPDSLDLLRSLDRECERSGVDEARLVVATRVGTSPDRHQLARSVGKLCAKADVPRITPYELRHTAITHQADAGWSSFEIADWAGTSEKMISERYRHRLRRVSRLRPGDSL